jgi:orotate phosphoribosyltransferase
MNEQEVLALFGKVGAIIVNSHIVYTSGKHGTAYVNKDALYPHTKETSAVCLALARKFVPEDIEVVVAPVVGGVILSQWVASHLSYLTGREVLAVYAEKSETGDTFVIKRGYDKLVAGKRALVVEDILNTGGTAKKVLDAVRTVNIGVVGGRVIGLGVLCNRGGSVAQDFARAPLLRSLVDIKLDAWDEADCPLCAQGVPVNTDVGKGREFLARKQK